MTRPNGTPKQKPKQKQTLRDWVHRTSKDVGFQLIQKIEHFVGRASLVGDRPFHEAARHPGHFAWTRRLEDNWPAIRAELDRVLERREELPNFQDISTDQKAITDDDDWKTFFLYGFGYKAEANCRRCPATTALVESVPGMKTAFFSILSPGKHIPEHRGPYKGVLRYHLGLKVPSEKEKCRLRVADEYAHWEEGKGLIFDDTYRHEVWNETEEERAILFMDVERPMRFPWSLLNKAVIAGVGLSPFVQEARRNQERWSERLGPPSRATDTLPAAGGDEKQPSRASVVSVTTTRAEQGRAGSDGAGRGEAPAFREHASARGNGSIREEPPPAS